MGWLNISHTLEVEKQAIVTSNVIGVLTSEVALHGLQGLFQKYVIFCEGSLCFLHAKTDIGLTGEGQSSGGIASQCEPCIFLWIICIG